MSTATARRRHSLKVRAAKLPFVGTGTRPGAVIGVWPLIGRSIQRRDVATLSVVHQAMRLRVRNFVAHHQPRPRCPVRAEPTTNLGSLPPPVDPISRPWDFNRVLKVGQLEVGQLDWRAILPRETQVRSATAYGAR